MTVSYRLRQAFTHFQTESRNFWARTVRIKLAKIRVKSWLSPSLSGFAATFSRQAEKEFFHHLHRIVGIYGWLAKTGGREYYHVDQP